MNDFPVKDSSLFYLYESTINLKLDTLNSKGFPSDYLFLSVVPLKDNKVINDSALTYNRTNHLSYLSIPINNCEGYILCINKSSGRSFRIQGFYGNDFLTLLQEVKEESMKSREKKLSTKSFLHNYSVEGLDFKCIYKGLRSGEKDTKKFPCLKNCSDFTIVIH